MREDEQPSVFRGTDTWSLLLHWSAKETMFKCLNAESRFERSCVSPIFCIDMQHVLPCGHDPLGRYGDQAEDKSLYATPFLEPESLGVKLANE